MATMNRIQRTTIQATEDLSDKQYRVISVAGALSVGGPRLAAGIVLNKPNSGQLAEVAYSGEMKARFGLPVNANSPGIPVTTAGNGFIIAASSGDLSIGKLKSFGQGSTNVASGEIATIIADFTAPAATQA